jgi:hypothetical protein
MTIAQDKLYALVGLVTNKLLITAFYLLVTTPTKARKERADVSDADKQLDEAQEP